MADFPTNIRFRQQHVRHDKITVHIGTWAVVYDFEDFFEALSEIPAASSADTSQRVFQSPRRYGNRIRSVTLNHSNPLRQDQPLFGGQLKILYRQDDHSRLSPRHVRCQFALNINPTRIARYQDTFDLAYEPALLCPRERASSDGDEYSLDGADNFLPSGISTPFATPSRWSEEVIRYIRAAETFLESRLSQAHAQTETELHRSEHRIDLRVVEAYFDYSADDPIGLVREIEPYVLALSSRSWATTYRPPHGSNLVRNARSISVRLSNERAFKVYAKTNRRVRFEVSYDLGHHNAVTAILGPGGRVCEGEQRYERVREHLDTITSNAFRTLRTHTVNLYRRSRERQMDGLSFYVFVSRIVERTTTTNHAEQILSMLVNNGYIDPQPLPDTLRRNVERLARGTHPVLRRNGPRNVYIPTHRYEAAVAALRAVNPASDEDGGG